MRRVSTTLNSLGRLSILVSSVGIASSIPILPLRASIPLISISITLYILIVSGWAYARVRAASVERLRIRRVVPKTVLNGDTVEVRLIIENRGFTGVYNVEYMDSYPESTHLVDGRNRGRISIPPYSIVEIRYLLKVEGVGRHRFGPVYIRTMDILGMYTIELIDHGVESSAIKCYPESLSEMTSYEEVVRREYIAGLHRTVEMGYTMEFKDLREYRPGDTPRFIDWKSTARTGRLMIREFYREVERDVVVIVNISPYMLMGRLGYRKYDYISNAISKLLSKMLVTRDRVGYVHFGLAEPVIIPLRRVDITHMHTILEAISSVDVIVERGSIYRPIDFKGIIPRIGLRGKTLFLFITDLEREEEIAMVETLRILRHTVYVISPSTTEFTVREATGLERTVLRILRVGDEERRRRLISRLLRRGIPTIDVGPETILDELIGRIEEFGRATPT